MVVPEGEALLEIADLRELEIVADFLSAEAVMIKPGMLVIVERCGGEALLKGRVERIEPVGFMKISALGVEEQRVNVIVDFLEPREAWERIGDQYRVEVRVIVWESEDVLRVPGGALFRRGNEWAVFVVEADRAKLRPVVLGRRNNLHAEVVGGLNAGDKVVIYPSDRVSDGVLVEPRAETSR